MDKIIEKVQNGRQLTIKEIMFFVWSQSRGISIMGGNGMVTGFGEYFSRNTGLWEELKKFMLDKENK